MGTCDQGAARRAQQVADGARAIKAREKAQQKRRSTRRPPVRVLSIASRDRLLLDGRGLLRPSSRSQTTRRERSRPYILCRGLSRRQWFTVVRTKRRERVESGGRTSSQPDRVRRRVTDVPRDRVGTIFLVFVECNSRRFANKRPSWNGRGPRFVNECVRPPLRCALCRRRGRSEERQVGVKGIHSSAARRRHRGWTERRPHKPKSVP